MHELIISGQRVDLGADTSITLEWVSGLFEDIGSIQMSRSYTIRLPKTARNLRILDDPGNPAHESSKTRRYLDAQYIRNGVDLLGPAKAYVVRVTSDGIEVGLLWRIVPGLQELRDSGKKLRDLTTLPTLTWIGSNGNTPDYSKEIPDTGVVFAHYDSGLRDYTYPEVNGATHPAITFKALFDAIARENDIAIETSAAVDLENILLLCDGHHPSRRMDIDSGASSSGLFRFRVQSDGGRLLSIGNVVDGWDSPHPGVVATYFLTTSPVTGKTMKKMYLDVRLAHFRQDLYDENKQYKSLIGNSIQLVGTTHTLSTRVLAEWPFVANESGEIEFVKTSIDINTDGLYDLSFRIKYAVEDPAIEDGTILTLYAYESVKVAYAHDSINLSYDDTFPVAVNLPEMTQVEFIKGACALLGIMPVVRGAELHFVSYARALNISEATDWTRLIDSLDTLMPAYNGLSQRNYIRYAENADLAYESVDSVIVTEDDTISESSDLFSLPYAASIGSQAIHYHVTEQFEDGVITYSLEDIDIKPRVFEAQPDRDSGELRLNFPDRLRGQALIDTYYALYQAAVRKPVIIEAIVRLSEIDLAGLDFTRPIYLSQTGQYYAIMKVQSDDSELCKVELIQIA